MRRMTGLLCVALAFTATASATEPPPWLSQMDAVNISTAVANKLPGVKDVNVVPYPYDTNLHLWVTLIKPEGEGFLVTINEETGEVCARYEHKDGCAATGSAKEAIDRAKTRAAARYEAVRTPPPDLDGLQIVLLRSLAPASATGFEPPSQWYVTVKRPDGTSGDPSPAVLNAIHIGRIQVQGGSAAPKTKGPEAPETSSTMHYSIDTPLRRPDGNYDVTYGYYCGALCAASMVAVMSHDAHGWHIVSTTTQWVS